MNYSKHEVLGMIKDAREKAGQPQVTIKWIRERVSYHMNEYDIAEILTDAGVKVMMK